MLRNLLVLFVLLVLTACSGGPSITINGECLADSQCEEGFFCNDKSRCEEISPLDGDMDTESSGEDAEDLENEE